VFTSLAPAPRRRAGATVVVTVLAVATLSCALMQTVIIPLIPQLPTLLDVTPDQASWLVTATLITGAISLPTISRLADMFGKRRMILLCLAALFVGSMLSVFATSLTVQIVARSLQGFSFALVPATFSILRDELPRERLTMAVALISATLGLGGAIGLPVAGIVFNLWGWHAVFWLAGGLALLTAVAVILVIPESPVRAGGRFDLLGALLLSGALLALLVAITNGNNWGWLSLTTVGLLAVSLLLFVAWFPWELRTTDPLVDLRTSSARPVLLVNIAALLAGIAMFGNMISTTQLLQEPEATGYGFGLTVLQAGVAFLPIGLIFVVFAPLAGALSRICGPELTLILGCSVMFVGYVSRIWLMGSPAQVVVGACIVAIGMTTTLSTLAVIIMKSVPLDETAAANGLNTLARTAGFAVASAAVTAVLASATTTVGGVDLPTQAAYVGLFVLGACASLGAGLAAFAIPRGDSRAAATADLVSTATDLPGVVA